MLQDALLAYGLNEKEAKVYLACLEYQSVLPSTLASKLGMNRVTCYDILLGFVKKGLVAETIQNGTKRFSPLSPELLLQSLESKYKTFGSALPLLLGMRGKHGIKPTLRRFEGLEGMKALYADTLTSSEPIYAWVGNHVADPLLLDYFAKEYVPARVAKKIFAYVILSDSPANRVYHKSDKKGYRKSIFLPDGVGDIECEIDLYSTNKLMIALYDKGDMCGFIIESERIYNTIKTIFTTIRKVLEKDESTISINGENRKKRVLTDSRAS